MKIIIAFFIFCLVLFIYLHIQFHLKTSEDLEMYEVEQPSKDKLEEICDIRQPVLFDFDCEKIMESSNKSFISDNYSAFEVKIRNVRDNDPNIELYVPLPLYAAIKLFDVRPRTLSQGFTVLISGYSNKIYPLNTCIIKSKLL